MKTNVVMIRPMGQFEVQQRTKDGFFNATDLLRQWNAANPWENRRLDNFWQSTNLSKFMKEVVNDPQNCIECNSLDFRDLKNILVSLITAHL